MNDDILKTDEVETTTEYPELPDFCFNQPLYNELEFSGENGYRKFLKFIRWTGQYDAYCTECDRHSVFTNEYTTKKTENPLLVSANGIKPAGLHPVIFACTRDPSHYIIFLLYQYEETLQKIGQVPSLAETQLGELNKFRSILDRETSGEFHKALGLSAHDVGIGAFVYLRRVLERLIEKREAIAISDGSLLKEQIEGKRIAERIKQLRGHLPDLLVDNPKIYSVLSKGVHELEEKECLAVFPALRDLMFFILEEDLENETKRSRLASAMAALSNL
ncbi:MAG: hypothetical protein RH946_13170 [Rhodospirillales bacterium]